MSKTLKISAYNKTLCLCIRYFEMFIYLKVTVLGMRSTQQIGRGQGAERGKSIINTLSLFNCYFYAFG